jgi:hypothetical protein
MKQWTMTEVLFLMDWYHDEVKEIFIGHPTLNALEMIEISGMYSVEDGRQPLVLALADALLESRQQYIICKMIFDRVHFNVGDLGDPIDGYLSHADNMLTYSHSPSIYTMSEDVANTLAMSEYAYDSNAYWETFEQETEKHIEIIREVLQ